MLFLKIACCPNLVIFKMKCFFLQYTNNSQIGIVTLFYQIYVGNVSNKFKHFCNAYPFKKHPFGLKLIKYNSLSTQKIKTNLVVGTGCPTWIGTKVNECYDYVFRVRYIHFDFWNKIFFKFFKGPPTIWGYFSSF